MRGRRNKQRGARAWDIEGPAAVREALERRWHRRTVFEPELGDEVTPGVHTNEPFHRWLAFKQSFSPVLVRRFLAEAEGLTGGDDAPPVLDPFAGTGTVAVECTRQGMAAAGVEASASLAFVASAKGQRSSGDWPDLGTAIDWPEIADRLTDPLHQAALICAVANLHNADGRLRQDAPPLVEELRAVCDRIREDLRNPLASPVDVRQGDARQLGGFADGSCRGVLTSPPYLSRHDYTRTLRPLEEVFARWHGGQGMAERRERQIRAHPRAYGQQWEHVLPGAVGEAVAELRAGQQPKLAGVVRSYFEDMVAALGECRRVLRPGCPCWFVVGGARLKGVYVPSDLIIAELAEAAGFAVSTIRVARRLTPSGRKLGTLTNVAPRESIVVMQAV